ncbi:DegT/DnrJ/EryC1/StrS family aminotransferase [Haloarcula pelagica]|uniref:DegT/DnrJ/EryC1/StrS family aminotransferase n=1 Tax=Haloarcula pelagica TaxID=3033389 RepID=UPI0024C2E36E|nr:DegT/DnrJ/EryC1/StrS family aminotransferase [Halomicroarcula sp. YJ-61-S]
MIPVADPQFGAEEVDAVSEVLRDGRVADGPEVRQFESEFADYCDASHGVATANGTAALHAMLEGVGIGPGDTVVTTPFSFVASANAIRLAGATPAFADIDPRSFTLEPHDTRRVVRETDAEAILAVHLYGLPAAMDALAEIAAAEDARLLVDAAQAHGARYRGDPVGSRADATAFSFYPTKNMTTGEGGMVVTDEEGIADRIASYVNHGRTDGGGYSHERVGHNYRLTSLAAAIGRVQLQHLPDWVETRRDTAAALTRSVETVPGIEPPVEPAGRRHAYHQYTVRCTGQSRDHVRDHLADHGVGAAVYYPTPIHKLGAYDGFDADAPVAERVAEDVLSLPVHPGLSDEDIDRITAALDALDSATEVSA